MKILQIKVFKKWEYRGKLLWEITQWRITTISVVKRKNNPKSLLHSATWNAI